MSLLIHVSSFSSAETYICVFFYVFLVHILTNVLFSQFSLKHCWIRAMFVPVLSQNITTEKLIKYDCSLSAAVKRNLINCPRCTSSSNWRFWSSVQCEIGHSLWPLKKLVFIQELFQKAWNLITCGCRQYALPHFIDYLPFFLSFSFLRCPSHSQGGRCVQAYTPLRGWRKFILVSTNYNNKRSSNRHLIIFRLPLALQTVTFIKSQRAVK